MRESMKSTPRREIIHTVQTMMMSRKMLSNRQSYPDHVSQPVRINSVLPGLVTINCHSLSKATAEMMMMVIIVGRSIS